MISNEELLVVAAEASGDALAAAAVRASGRPAFGLGGDRLREAGARVVVDLRSLSANGLGDALRVAPRALSIAARLALEAARQRPRAALLVDSTALNRPLGRALRLARVPVVWCVAPQVWAWLPGRAPALARSMDRLATLFAFEVPLWRRLGVDARWVGHPAIEAPLASRAEARARLGLPPSAPALALLPGSRPGEVRRLLLPFVEAASALARGGARPVLLLAPSLPPDLAAWAGGLAARAGVAAQRADGGLSRWLGAFDAALCASGTASLECALAGVPTAVAYRLDALSAWAARRWLEIDHVALPSVLLGRRVFAELLQEQASAAALAAEAHRLLGGPPCADVAAELRALLDPGDGLSFGARVAAMLP